MPFSLARRQRPQTTSRRLLTADGERKPHHHGFGIARTSPAGPCARVFALRIFRYNLRFLGETAMLCRLFIIMLLLPAVAMAQDRFIPNANQIERIEISLLEIGWYKSLPQRTMSPKLREAISDWQKGKGVTVTGEVTKEQFDELAALDVQALNHVWAAVSASTDGKYGAVSGRTSALEAMREAHRICVTKSRSPAKCKDNAGYGDKNGPWPVTVVNCTRKIKTTTYWHVYTNSSETYEKAIKQLEDARDEKFRASDCRKTVSIDGTGKRY